MRPMHAGLVLSAMDRRSDSAHVSNWCNPRMGDEAMFVRAVWRLKRLVDIKQQLRELDVPTSRDADLLGISGPDFSKMTRGLFDR